VLAPRVRAAARGAFASWRASLDALDPGLPDDVDSLVVAALEGAILLARAEDDPSALDRVGRSLRCLLEAGDG
jgi:hypothetical protein